MLERRSGAAATTRSRRWWSRSGQHDDQDRYLRRAPAQTSRASRSPTRYLRDYPYGSLAPRCSATSDEISPEQLKAARSGQGYRAGDKIGQAGVESTYDRYLRGGRARPAHGRLARAAASQLRRRSGAGSRATRSGSRSTSAPARGRARAPLRDRARAGRTAQWAANGGAIVALDPNDGVDPRHGLEPDLQAVALRRPVNAKRLAPPLDARRPRRRTTRRSNRAIGASTRRARPSSPSRRSPRCRSTSLAVPSSPCTPATVDGTAGQVFNNWDPSSTSG